MVTRRSNESRDYSQQSGNSRTRCICVVAQSKRGLSLAGGRETAAAAAAAAASSPAAVYAWE